MGTDTIIKSFHKQTLTGTRSATAALGLAFAMGLFTAPSAGPTRPWRA